MIAKRILLNIAVFCLMGVPSAHAQIGVQVDLGLPVFIAPQPYYPYPEYYDPRHRNHDFAYWQEQHRGRGHEGHGGGGHERAGRGHAGNRH